MVNALLALATIVSAELFLRIPLSTPLRRIMVTARKASTLLRSGRISDAKKETVLPVYAFRIGTSSLLAFFFMLLCVTPFFLSSCFMQDGASTLSERMLSPDAGIGVMVLAIGYIWIRKKCSKCRIIP